MKLPERFVMVIEGKLWNVARRHNIVPASLPYLLGRLLSGNEMTEEPFEAFGLRVSVEEDKDQADDEPDGLSVRR